MRQRKSRRDRARFRVGRVSVYFHHSAWWLYFRESDRPVRRRVAETREAAERIAAEVNAQLSAATHSSKVADLLLSKAAGTLTARRKTNPSPGLSSCVPPRVAISSSP